MKKYITFVSDLHIQTYENSNMLFIKNKTNLINKKFYINDEAINIIKLIDGTRSLEEVIHELCHTYNDKYNNIEKLVTNFLVEIQKNFEIETKFIDKPISKKVAITKFENNYPTVASIELTYKCNLRCLHCYGSYGESTIEMDKENALKLLRDLKEIGVRLVEFTGGDICVYPYLKDVIHEALKLDFDFIGLLTNSILLKDEIKDIIIKNRSKFVVQIDLHSLNDNYLKYFTGSSHTVDIIKNNIEYMAKNKVLTRIATIITKRNLDEIDEIIEWAYNTGVSQIALSPVVNIGRALNQDRDLLLDDIPSMSKFNRKIEEYNHKYPGFLALQSNIDDERKNCGALTTNVAIAPTGDIKLCVSDSKEYHLTKFGNVFKKSIKDIYNDNSEYSKALMSIEKPDYNQEECKDCKYKWFCSSCLLRAFLKRKELGDDCKWYNKQVPMLVKDRLSI